MGDAVVAGDLKAGQNFLRGTAIPALDEPVLTRRMFESLKRLFIVENFPRPCCVKSVEARNHRGTWSRGKVLGSGGVAQWVKYSM